MRGNGLAYSSGVKSSNAWHQPSFTKLSRDQKHFFSEQRSTCCGPLNQACKLSLPCTESTYFSPKSPLLSTVPIRDRPRRTRKTYRHDVSPPPPPPLPPSPVCTTDTSDTSHRWRFLLALRPHLSLSYLPHWLRRQHSNDSEAYTGAAETDTIPGPPRAFPSTAAANLAPLPRAGRSLRRRKEQDWRRLWRGKRVEVPG